jgi:dipicolinate synthase subunit A
MEDAVYILDLADKRNIYLNKLLSADGSRVEEFNIKKQYAGGAYIYIFAPSTEIDMGIAEAIIPGSVIFCIKIDDIMLKYLELKDVKVHRFFDDEVLAMQNAYITAEGALAYIILNTPKTLRESTALIMGYGRLGKALTGLIKKFGASVYVATNPIDEIALAKVNADYVCTINNCRKHLNFFDIIINTIPARVLDEKDYAKINKECFILDLASKPGGIDEDKVKELKLNMAHALGIPGKTASRSAAEHIRESVYRMNNINKGKL